MLVLQIEAAPLKHKPWSFSSLIKRVQFDNWLSLCSHDRLESIFLDIGENNILENPENLFVFFSMIVTIADF
jgi:hypothetical protein